MVSSARAKITPKPAKPTAKKKTSKPAAAKPPKIENTVTVDSTEFAAALADMTRQMNVALGTLAGAFTELDNRIAALAEGQTKLLKAISEQKPTVNMPARPGAFSVEIVESEPGLKKMRVIADRTH